MRRALRWFALGAGAAVLGAAAYAFGTLRASLPQLGGVQELAALRAPVTVTSDRFAIPTVYAESRADALRALGYLTARDRLFQMDLARRASAGTLAELFGAELLASDTRQRALAVVDAAAAITAALPAQQRAALEAYAEGVNAYLRAVRTWPFEFQLLGYRPAPWTSEDSILVTLGMFQALAGREEEERMRSVLARCVPQSVQSFLLPVADRYTSELLGPAGTVPGPAPLPAEALRALRGGGAGPRETAAWVRAGEAPRGSNAWAVAGTRTRDGRALLANDMHLELAVPNVWYRAALRYGDVRVSGVVLPGVPAIIAGSNTHVAWGLTSLDADVLDLVRLELRPGNPDEYLTPAGWRRLERRSERIHVRGGADVSVPVQRTIWGPLAPQPLLGAPVAVRWSALDPAAVDVGWLELAEAPTLEAALGVANRAGGPGGNALFADERGRIAWTLTGRMPRRRGLDGAVSESWADGSRGWDGYLAPGDLPRSVDPAAGFLVSANQRTREADAVVAGHDFANGYRAWRITERLHSLERADEAALFALQLDADAGFFEPYRALALQALGAPAAPRSGVLAQLRRALEAWDGRAEASSTGLALLVRWRRVLARELFGSWLERCRALEPAFEFAPADIDTPLLQALQARPPGLVPGPARDWDDFLLGTLQRAAAELESRGARGPLERLAWGTYNRVRIEHPLAAALPGSGWLLSMPPDPLPGCGFCVRVAAGTLGGSERLVVSPGREPDGLLHMPGGESGHPLSPHYRDQQRAWVEGRPLPFLAGPAEQTLRLRPSAQSPAVSTGQHVH